MPRHQTVTTYHERTKHHFDRYARSPDQMDWATQPDPFRRFADAPLIQLSLASSKDSIPYEELYSPTLSEPHPLTGPSVGALFEFSLALSAWKEQGGSRWALRVNPSSGNLHPTEAYLLAPAMAGWTDQPGVYHYAPKAHGLERRASLTLADWQRLTDGFPESTLFVGLSSIHWREAWKYGERAYRYCQHDVGHAIAAVGFAAALLGWRATWLDGLGDADVATLLGLSRDGDFEGAEREHPDLLMAIVPQGDASVPRSMPRDAIESVARATWAGRANRLSVSQLEWAVIETMSEACVKEREDPDASASERRHNRDTTSQRVGGFLSARAVIRGRRSAVAMDGQTILSKRAFLSMMDRVMPRSGTAPWSALGLAVCVHLLLFVHRVEGVSPGLYFLARDADEMGSLREAMKAEFEWTVPEWSPADLPLRRLMAGNARRVATQVSCHQQIAGDGAFSVGMIARFTPALEAHGAWFYRRLFWEAGALGQVLYLEAEAAGVRGTGIGCYFDDAVHQLLGLTGTEYQSLYHFTVGGPVEDSRLSTLPPYGSSPRGT